MESEEVTLAVFVDFSKAFDTVNFNILIYKHHSLHFSKNFLYLILNYLSNRSHFVLIDSRRSNRLYSNFNVPQRLVLGPVLFDLHVTDMKNCCSQSLREKCPFSEFLWSVFSSIRTQ